jgi:gamma-glutamyltranspeptidase/glutathione hydrolase
VGDPIDVPRFLSGTRFASGAARFSAVPSGAMKLGKNGLVAAAEPHAVQVGEAVLSHGGNAIEAAVATAAALGVVEPYASGIGGGGFMVIHLAEAGRDLVIDSRVIAPQSATPDMFVGLPDDSTLSGGLPVGVPGAVRHWETALAVSRDLLGGTLSFSDLLQPAIRLAADGFPLSDTFIAILQRNTRLALFPDSTAVFHPSLKAGDTLVQTDLARTLHMLAEGGPDAFYAGPIAEALVRAVQRPATTDNGKKILPGRMTGKDLTSYSIKRRDPLFGDYRGHKLITVGPPASGVNVLEMLNILEHYPIGTAGFRNLETNTAHLMIEAMKLAYADRVHYLADPEFVSVPVAGIVSKGFAEQRQKSIDLNRSLELPVRHGDAGSSPGVVHEDSETSQEESSSTTHISVIDARGNMVSYTTTLSELFGSAMVVPGFGYLLNDTLRDFDRDGSGPNAPAGGKRPKSGISPMVILKDDGSPRAVLGAAGGNRIPAIVFSLVTNLLDHRLGMEATVNAPRFVNENRLKGDGVSQTRREPPPFQLEQSLLDELRGRGQTLLKNSLTFGAAQGIAVDPDTGVLTKGIDGRRGGEF